MALRRAASAAWHCGIIHRQRILAPAACLCSTDTLDQPSGALHVGGINGVHTSSACTPRTPTGNYFLCPAFPAHMASDAFAARALSSDTQAAVEDEFHRNVDNTLENLLEELEEVIDGRGLEDADIEYGQGVLTMKLEGKGTYVINKQAPNQQIWMSSPISGPVRYDFDDGHWVYRRDGHRMHDRLEQELGELLGGHITLSRP